MGKTLEVAKLAIVIFYLPNAWAQFEQQRQVDYPLQGVVLGNGWSTLAATKTPGGCVEFAVESDQSEDRTLDMRRVVDKEQLNRELNVSTEFQAKTIGGIGASAKATYAKSLEVKNEALNLIISARVMQGARFVTAKPGTQGIRLTESALALASNNMPNFLALCGDSFVEAIHAGGELNAFLTFDVASAEERESISASMSASGLSYSGSASMNQTMRTYRESQKLHILMHSAGGTGVPIPVNEQELLARLGTLPADAKTAPKPYRISILRYDALPNWPQAELATVKYGEMERLVGQYQRYRSLYYDTYNVLQNPENYLFRGALTIESIRKLQDKLRLAVLPSISARITECLGGKSCDIPTDGAHLDYVIRAQMPVRMSSFVEDKQLSQLKADIVAKEAEYAAMKDYLKIPFSIANPAKPILKKQLDDLKVGMSEASSKYPAALANSMFKQWIESPSYYRCIADPVWDYCLSQSELAEYKSKVESLVK